MNRATFLFHVGHHGWRLGNCRGVARLWVAFSHQLKGYLTLEKLEVIFGHVPNCRLEIATKDFLGRAASFKLRVHYSKFRPEHIELMKAAVVQADILYGEFRM